MFCVKCGKEIQYDAKFCPKCGAAVIHTQTSTLSQSDSAHEEPLKNPVPDCAPYYGVSAIPFSEANKTSSGPAIEANKSYTSKEEVTSQESAATNENETQKRSFSLLKGRTLQEKLESYHSMPTAGKILLPIIMVIRFLIVAVLALFAVAAVCVIFQLIFSSAISIIVAIVVGYLLYQSYGACFVTKYIYKHRGNDLKLPDEMDAQNLIESLSGKFNYPYFKGVRYGAEGECLIEGKYSSYQVKFIDKNHAKLDYIPGEKENTIMREAIAIRSYINKFFNPSLPFDAIKDLKALQSSEKQRIVAVFVVFIATVLIAGILLAEYVFPGSLQQVIRPGIGVRDAYLTSFSEEVTVEEAFHNFFDNEKWSTYDSEGYSYVVFTGVCEYLNERADVRITFKVTGENFIVDRLDINGQTQNDLILFALMEKIYENY